MVIRLRVGTDIMCREPFSFGFKVPGKPLEVLFAMVEQQHEFKSVTFKKPTFCDYCSNFIWGLGFKQGHSCVGCGYKTHKHCTSSVITPCYPNDSVEYGSYNDTESVLSSSTTSSTLRPRSRAGESSQRLRSKSSNGSQRLRTKSSDSQSIVAEIFQETYNQKGMLASKVVEANPTLAMSVFMKQNNRFTARQKPFIWIQDTVMNLLFWKQSNRTLTFLLVYIVLCTSKLIRLASKIVTYTAKYSRIGS